MGNIFSISIPLDPLVSGCWSCIRAEANYIRKLENNFHALETALQNLTDRKNNVKRRVSVAEQQQRATLEEVKSWIIRVEKAECDINKVIKDGAQEIEKLCFGGCCSKNCTCIYKFGKKVAQKLEFVASLHREGDFKDVADTAASASVDVKPSEPTMVEDMDSTFYKVWKCLEQNEVGAVGLYGVGGVGKTTLLTQINNQFDKTPIGFDFVIWVTVSKDLNLDKVQDDIWERIVGVLDDGWKQKNRSRKADAISNFLSKKKFVLLLDDIWEQVDLKEVGIPIQKNADEYKLVFTTRSKTLMGAKMIEVKCLSREKAWELFEKKVGDNDALCNPKIRQLAEKMAEECDGLPLALIATGSAMASKKTIEEWEREIDILKNSASKFSGMEKVFARLQFSYDKLQRDKLQRDTYKFCFLFCALFPEDYMIDKRCLIDYWIGEGLLGEFDDLNRTRLEGHHIIGTLLNACLLEDEEGNIKMHDVFRDMALWMVGENEKEKKNYFLVKAGAGLTKAPEIHKWEGAKKISLMRNKIEKLTGTPCCPNLTTLFLSDNRLAEISDGVFDQMPNLLVLDLSRNEIKEVPLGISKLVLLQYLNLSHTRISQLRIELRSLVNLKYLNLERSSVFIPEDLISCFSKLQVFILNDSGGLQKDFLSNEGFIRELESLQDLEDLRIDITNVSSLQRFCLSEKLQRCTRYLRIHHIDHLRSLNVSSIKSWNNSLHTFIIYNLDSLAEVEIDWAWAQRDEIHLSIIRSESISHSLRYVYVSECDHLREMTWLVFAPNIICIQLRSCPNMKEVMSVKKLDKFLNEAENLNPFSSLETLFLANLRNLKSIYPNALSFPCLKKVTVINCPQLKRLPLNSKSAKNGRNITIEGKKEWWDNLHWDDEATLDTFLPSFKEKNSYY